MKISEKIKSFVGDSKRIFHISKKPTMDEYKKMILITGLGIILIGGIGFIIALIFNFLKVVGGLK
ncbi:MAG: protein translocase SEC61 complex subunit gamma [Candidatus ainarchaeum sp.]|nr:protein translocase SEC61 complex subunit gamma [Candidatus ainarchaeum sp.]